MNNVSKYYNEFYKELALIDAKHNSSKKIEGFVPELRRGMKILDVGCGYGSVSSEFIEYGCEVYGMELNADCLVELEKKGYKVIEHDFSTPFQLKQSFDLILLLDVMEHIFDPLGLLEQAVSNLNDRGTIIVSVPLYFDLVDRIRILFTGKIVSYDNLCYGRTLYSKFRSYNYDHIRFFRPRELFEMARIASLNVTKVKYIPISMGRFMRPLVKLLFNSYTAKVAPSLIAHSMILQMKK